LQVPDFALFMELETLIFSGSGLDMRIWQVFEDLDGLRKLRKSAARDLLPKY
jgi:hypothetical protein